MNMRGVIMIMSISFFYYKQSLVTLSMHHYQN